jgi:hypothetical protein
MFEAGEQRLLALRSEDSASQLNEEAVSPLSPWFGERGFRNSL